MRGITGRRLRWSRGPILLGLVMASTSGCAGDGPSGASGSGTYGRIQREIFDQSCVLGACHNATTRAGGLSLTPDESYGQLVDVEPMNPVAAQRGLLRVTPGVPEESFLLLKVQGDLMPGEGDPMPLAAAPLSESQIQLISDWIAEGAPPDEPAAAADDSAF